MSNALFDLGKISGETIFIDGTKIEATANKAKPHAKSAVKFKKRMKEPTCRTALAVLHRQERMAGFYNEKSVR